MPSFSTDAPTSERRSDVGNDGPDADSDDRGERRETSPDTGTAPIRSSWRSASASPLPRRSESPATSLRASRSRRACGEGSGSSRPGCISVDSAAVTAAGTTAAMRSGAETSVGTAFSAAIAGRSIRPATAAGVSGTSATESLSRARCPSRPGPRAAAGAAASTASGTSSGTSCANESRLLTSSWRGKSAANSGLNEGSRSGKSPSSG